MYLQICSLTIFLRTIFLSDSIKNPSPTVLWYHILYYKLSICCLLKAITCIFRYVSTTGKAWMTISNTKATSRYHGRVHDPGHNNTKCVLHDALCTCLCFVICTLIHKNTALHLLERSWAITSWHLRTVWLWCPPKKEGTSTLVCGKPTHTVPSRLSL